MTTKEELRRIVDALSDATAAELLDYTRWLQQESETLTDDERARRNGSLVGSIRLLLTPTGHIRSR